MPLPSTIAGLIGAILGIRRKFLIEFVKQKDMHCGAELIGFDGYISEYVRFFKFPKKRKSEILKLLEDPKKRKELMPVYKSLSLFQPKYRIAIAVNDEDLRDELMYRLRNFEFVYDVYGGNDYNFVDRIWAIKKAKILTSDRGRGYCSIDDFKSVEPDGKAIISSDVVLANVKKKFVFVCYGEIILKNKLLVVQDDESRVIVHKASPFLVTNL